MLDDRERRVLADMERRLAEQEPALAASAARHDRVLGPPWWPFVCLVAGLAVAVFVVTLGLVGNALLLLGVAAAPLAPRCARAISYRRRRGP